MLFGGFLKHTCIRTDRSVSLCFVSFVEQFLPYMNTELSLNVIFSLMTMMACTKRSCYELMQGLVTKAH